MAPKHALLSSNGSSGPRVEGVNRPNKGASCSSSPAPWTMNAGMVAVCSPRNGKRTRALDGMLARWIVTIGAVLMLMMQSSLAADGKALMLCDVSTCKSGPLIPYCQTNHHMSQRGAEFSDSYSSLKMA